MQVAESGEDLAVEEGGVRAGDQVSCYPVELLRSQEGVEEGDVVEEEARVALQLEQERLQVLSWSVTVVEVVEEQLQLCLVTDNTRYCALEQSCSFEYKKLVNTGDNTLVD